jgi:hypothetical protein
MSRPHRERSQYQPPPIAPSDRVPPGMIEPQVTIEDEGCGPAMLALNTRQRAFVHAKTAMGLSNVAAAKFAGYSDRSPNAADVNAYRLSHDQRIQDAILEEGRKLMRGEGAKSILTLVQLRDNPQIEAKDRIKCAVELLNRSGFNAVSEHHEHHHVHMSESEQDARILALCAELGLSPDEAKKMLIAPADMTRNAAGIFDLTPTEPTPEPTPQRVRKTELQRIRRNASPEELQAHKEQIRADRVERLRSERAEHQATKPGDFSDEKY